MSTMLCFRFSCWLASTMSASVYQLRGPNTAAFSPYFGYNAAGVGYPGVGMGYGGVGVGCGDYEETYGSCAYETQHQQQVRLSELISVFPWSILYWNHARGPLRVQYVLIWYCNLKCLFTYKFLVQLWRYWIYNHRDCGSSPIDSENRHW